MTAPVPFAPLLFIALLGLFFWDEFYGFLFLLCGFILFDRNFAYVNIDVNGLPLYVTEFALLLWTLSLLTRRRKEIPRLWHETPQALRWGWALYLAVGLYSASRGLWSFSVAATLRDFALCYYSLFIFLVASIEWTPKRLHQLLASLGVVAVLRALFVIFIKSFEEAAVPAFLHGQPAAASLGLCMSLLFLLTLKRFDLDVKSALAGIASLSAVMLLLVRSAWTGVAGGLLVALFSLARILPPALAFKRAMRTTLILSAGTYLVVAIVPAVLQSISPLSFFASASAQGLHIPFESVGTRPAFSPAAGIARAAQLQAQLESTTPAMHPLPPQQPPLLRRQSIAAEFLSFFQGRSSENVMTRLWMWRDAVSEVFGVGLFSPVLKKDDLKRYNLPPKMPLKGPNTYGVSIFPNGFSEKFLYLKVSTQGDARRTTGDFLRSVHQALFGIPFGKLFLPPELVWIMDSPNRFDPHNSLLAIFYRTGFTGLFSFVLLSVSFLRLNKFNLSAGDETARLVAYAITPAVACFLIHSITDNTLENPFKGIWYWSLLGLILGLYRRCRAPAD